MLCIKLIGVWRLIWAHDFVLMADTSITGATHKTDNGKYIKSFIEATLEAKKKEGVV